MFRYGTCVCNRVSVHLVFLSVKAGRDPSLNVVLLEDAASIIGVCIAASAIMTSSYLQSTIPDCIGSIAIGCLLGGVSMFIIRTNTVCWSFKEKKYVTVFKAHLVGQSIPKEKIDEMVETLQKDPAVGSVHDVKATMMGIDKQRFKAEIDFNGRNITANYLETCDVCVTFYTFNSVTLYLA